jgi:Fusaric acid resistance protein-like
MTLLPHDGNGMSALRAILPQTLDDGHRSESAVKPPITGDVVGSRSRDDDGRMTSIGERLVAVRALPPGAGWGAVRAGISVLVPLLVLVAIDHVEWTLYATFGAFTSLYGRERVDLHRVVRQAAAGLAMIVVVALGALVAISSAREWLAIPIAAAVAVVATYVSARHQWRPPGALFHVFGFAAVASVPARASDLGPAIAVVSVSAAFAVLVGNLGALVRRARRTADPPAPERPIGGAPGSAWRHAVQSGLAVLAAGVVATGSDIGRPYWAMVAAVVPLMASDFASQLVRGMHRVIGTFIGLGVTWLLLELDLPAAAVVVIVAALQLATELLVGRNYALALICITPLALLIVHLAAPLVSRSQLLGDRVLETVIGVTIGLLVGYVARPRQAGRGLPSGVGS